MPDQRRRDDLLASLAQRGRRLPRPVVAVAVAWLLVMTVWGFVRSLS